MNAIQRTLLRRELAEHRGGFVWAPLVAVVLFIVITMGGMMAGSVAVHRNGGESMMVEGRVVNSVELGRVLSDLPPDRLQQVGQAVDISLWIAAAWPFMVLGFVAFFYCIATLYDERKDRSVLFWKSMPVSDRATVLSKALTVLVVAPLIAAALGAASMLAFYGVMSLWVVFHGGSALTLAGANPVGIMGQMVAALPVYALWALPTAGWLMLCSAVARSKPFLWAILVPVMAGVMVSMMSNESAQWFWQHVVQRSLLGFVPGGWLQLDAGTGFPMAAGNSLSALGSPALWLGAIAGVGMLMLAAYARRWKDEG